MRTAILTVLVCGASCITPPPSSTADAVSSDATDVSHDAANNGLADGAAAPDISPDLPRPPRAPHYQATLTIDAADVNVDVTSFPVPINLGSDDGLAAVIGDGDRVWFTDVAGAPIASEIINLNRSRGRLQAWVLWPELTTTGGGEVLLHVGDPAIVTVPALLPVWSGYAGVWHFRTGSDIFLDSAGSNRGLSMTTVRTTSGPVGSSLSLGPGEFLTVPDSAALRMSEFTIMAWVRAGTLDTPQPRTVIAKAFGTVGHWSYGMHIAEDRSLVGFAKPFDSAMDVTFPSDDPVPAVGWTHLAFTRNAAGVKLFIDGKKVHDQAFTQAIAFDEGDLFIGAREDSAGGDHRDFLVGGIDELMLLPEAKDAAWIELNREAQANDNFVRIGAFVPLEP